MISFNSSAGEIETNILKLKALNACESCNLQGANLTYADLRYANLTGAILYKADLRDAYLSNATLCNTETPWGIDDSGC